jgi:hypothetical protein
MMSSRVARPAAKPPASEEWAVVDMGDLPSPTDNAVVVAFPVLGRARGLWGH